MFNIFKKKKKNRVEMDFKAAFDLTGLPIVTFQQGETKLNFLLDTGSDNSLINTEVLKDLVYTKLNNTSSVKGLDGIKHTTSNCRMVITYNGVDFLNYFMIHDLSNAIQAVKSNYGVTIHGILGGLFFKRYKSILNYEELKAYLEK